MARDIDDVVIGVLAYNQNHTTVVDIKFEFNPRKEM